MGRKSSDDKEGNGRLKILETAEKVFAEKGFDGARVDEIAKLAGVNKALIYYYFESKDKLLEELFKNYINRTIQKKHEWIKDVNFLDLNQIRDYIGKNLDYVKEDGGEIFKIATVEALKNSIENDELFNMVDLFFEDMGPMLSDKGISLNDEKYTEFLINAFFFGMAPVVFYITMGEKWAKHYGVDKDELKRRFVSTLNEVYVEKMFSSMLVDKK
jgi:AcrR family transcriptional regulator